MARGPNDTRRYMEDQQRLAQSDVDYLLKDPYALLDRNALIDKSADYEPLFGFASTNPDIEDWLNSILTFNEQLTRLLEGGRIEEPRIEKTCAVKHRQDEDDATSFNIPKTYGCLFCSKKFYSRAACCRHGNSHARRQLRCQRCRHRTRSLDELHRHVGYYHMYVRHHPHLPSF